MSDEIRNLILEIGQLRSQYVAEVGEGRRKWPLSIKERTERLDDLGVSAKQVSLQTGVGYETLLQWRYKRRQQFKRQFHEVEIKSQAKALVKIDTVTVPKSEIARGVIKVGTVTVTTPDGFKIEACDAESALAILKGLRVARCS
jgi:hypothetical protein